MMNKRLSLNGFTFNISISNNNKDFDDFFYKVIMPFLIEESEKFEFNLKSIPEMRDITFDILARIMITNGVNLSTFDGGLIGTKLGEKVKKQVSNDIDSFAQVELQKLDYATFRKDRTHELKKDQPHLTNSEIRQMVNAEWAQRSDN